MDQRLGWIATGQQFAHALGTIGWNREALCSSDDASFVAASKRDAAGVGEGYRFSGCIEVRQAKLGGPNVSGAGLSPESHVARLGKSTDC